MICHIVCYIIQRISRYKIHWKYFREDKVRTIVDDVMEKLPELFNMRELMGKVEERTPYVIVCFQVSIAFICQYSSFFIIVRNVRE